MKFKKSFFILFIILVLFGLLYLNKELKEIDACASPKNEATCFEAYYKRNSWFERWFFSNTNKTITNNVWFQCLDGKEIYATYFTNGNVDLKVYDNQANIILQENNLVKVDGYFLNSDKSLSFWSTGDEQMSTFLKQHDKVILQCKFRSSGE